MNMRISYEYLLANFFIIISSCSYFVNDVDYNTGMVMSQYLFRKRDTYSKFGRSRGDILHRWEKQPLRKDRCRSVHYTLNNHNRLFSNGEGEVINAYVFK